MRSIHGDIRFEYQRKRVAHLAHFALDGWHITIGQRAIVVKPYRTDAQCYFVAVAFNFVDRQILCALLRHIERASYDRVVLRKFEYKSQFSLTHRQFAFPFASELGVGDYRDEQC